MSLTQKRVILALILAIPLAVIDLYILNPTIYFMAFWLAWRLIK